MSPVSAQPRWTPPMPPVANTSTPAFAANVTAAETVVAPYDQRWAMATARSRSATFRAGPQMRSEAPRPRLATPSSTAVSAGTAPPERTAATHRSSASVLAGAGNPSSEKMVDSNATTGPPASSAAATSAERANCGDADRARSILLVTEPEVMTEESKFGGCPPMTI